MTTRTDPLTASPWPALPFIVTVCNQKGGVGKSTAVLDLAAMSAQRGMRTLAVDTDPQGTVAKASRIMRDYAQKHDLPNIGYEFTDPPETDPAILRRLRDVPGFDVIWVDTPGTLTDAAALQRLEQVLRWTDLAVIPSDFTVLSGGETIATAGYAARNGCRAMILLNGLDARFSVEAEARKESAARGLTCLAATITRYKVHQNAVRDKVPISRYPGEYGDRARAELSAVLDEILAWRPALLAAHPATTPMAAG